MTMTGCVRGGLALAAVLFIATPVVAQEVADIHEQRRERGSICFTDHYHYGSSSGLPTKKAATLAAIKSWADFVDFEYGGAWTSWRRSGSKSIKCSQAGIRGPWSCDVSSRPCRGGR
ncbi:hypothetical protein [Hyphomicrobium sp.]|jgi:hypothetical protein|uniref:hypothetical protein n=1 Tax=Hyphomicrobium sp. TaxID=82 RepID=UPI002C7A36F3|nr:hypothetical protein [Hyphomicrobium sp.]HVZ04281.1 hypothetical protein [Hyphomicrobium sp.]